MNKEEFINSKMKLSKEDIIYNAEEKLIEKLGIEHKIYELEQQCKKQKEVINKAIEKINDYKIYCKENKGFTEYTDIEIEAIEPVISKLEDILKEVSE